MTVLLILMTRLQTAVLRDGRSSSIHRHNNIESNPGKVKRKILSSNSDVKKGFKMMKASRKFTRLNRDNNAIRVNASVATGNPQFNLSEGKSESDVEVPTSIIHSNSSANGTSTSLINQHVKYQRVGEVSIELPVTEVPNTNPTEMPSLADLYEHLVCLSGISDNHFMEAKAMFTSVHHCLPDKKIIVYDLGLNSNHSDQVRNYANVELRPFPFHNYQPYVKELHTYAWKPIAIKLISQEYDVIMYGDASMRMISCDITEALAHLLKFPYINGHPRPVHAIEFTHDGMLNYLHFPKVREHMIDAHVLETNSYIMWASHPLMQEKLIEPWLDCALHQECIAPEGAKLNPCKFTTHHDGHYIGCHRYDQSALNIIMAREFGVDVAWRASNKTISDKIWVIRRLH